MYRILAIFLSFSLINHVISVQTQQDVAMDAEPEDAAVQNTFNSIDTDHNGQIDPIELSKYLDRFRHALKPFLGVSDYNAPIYPPPNRNYKSRHGENAFWAGFASGILSIWATEVGDKTFFIAAVLSMRNDRIIVFAGAIGALIIMTIISVVMGGVAAHFLPSEITHYIGAFMVRLEYIYGSYTR